MSNSVTVEGTASNDVRTAASVGFETRKMVNKKMVETQIEWMRHLIEMKVTKVIYSVSDQSMSISPQAPSHAPLHFIPGIRHTLRDHKNCETQHNTTHISPVCQLSCSSPHSVMKKIRDGLVEPDNAILRTLDELPFSPVQQLAR
jgi:hypothetical protein